MVEAEKIIIKPIISEKSYAQIDHNQYTFQVHLDAHKTMIAQAVAQLFNVTVVGVSTANMRPMPKRRGPGPPPVPPEKPPCYKPKYPLGPHCGSPSCSCAVRR